MNKLVPDHEAQMHILVKKIIVKYYVMEMDKIVAERIYSESMAI